MWLPLAFQKEKVHIAVDGGTQVPGPGDYYYRHPLYKGTDRGASAREPPQIVMHQAAKLVPVAIDESLVADRSRLGVLNRGPSTSGPKLQCQ